MSASQLAAHSAAAQRTQAPFGRRLLRVSAVQRLGAYTVLKAADPEGPPPDPGQFAMLASAERWGSGDDERPYLPRAFSYLRFVDGEAHFLLEDVGPGSERLCELEPGDGLWTLGPLGVGFTSPSPPRRAILLGGGVGIAPLAILQDSLERGGHEVTVLLGFRDAEHLAGAELLRAAQVASEDGSAAHHGQVTELLEAELDRDLNIALYACGPPAMLEAVRAIAQRRGIQAQLALEAVMACGFGACFGCVLKRRDGSYLRLCIDGPVVQGSELDRIEA